jgi:hypothetical protein
MRQTFLAAAAAALILSGGSLVNRAAAMPLAAPSALDAETATASLVQQAAVVCGGNGCAPVQTTRQRKRIIHPLGH